MNSRQEKKEHLFEKYPILENIEISFELPDGWFDLLDELMGEITQLLTEYNELDKLQIAQIKEKFAGLRFYFRLDSENEDLFKKVIAIVEKYMKKSESTCQICGKDSEITKKGHSYITLCPEHIELPYSELYNILFLRGRYW